MHDLLWRHASNDELKKSYYLQKENQNTDSICFTVSVYEINDQTLMKKYKHKINLFAESK